MGLVTLLLIRFGRPYSSIFFFFGGGRENYLFSFRFRIIFLFFLFSNFNANNTFPELRLVGGRWSGEGRVEILYNGTWGTVCDDGWDMNDAQVVCRALGYPSAISAPTHAHFGHGSGNIWLDDVNCFGHETSIDRCSHRGWNVHNCRHDEDASVICLGKCERHTNVFCSLLLCL